MAERLFSDKNLTEFSTHSSVSDDLISSFKQNTSMVGICCLFVGFFFFHSRQSNRSVKDFFFIHFGFLNVHRKNIKKNTKSPLNICVLFALCSFLFIFQEGKWILDNLVFVIWFFFSLLVTHSMFKIK